MPNETIPQKQMVKGLQTGVQGSMSAAGAPGQALTGLGRAISGVSEQGLNFAMKMQRVENRKTISELETDYRKRVADYQNTLTPGSDPSAWLEGLNKLNQTYQTELDNRELPREVRDEFGMRFNNLSSSYGMKMARDATIMSVNNGKIAFRAKADQYRAEGDHAGEEALWNTEEAKDLYSQEAREAAVGVITRRRGHEEVIGEIDVNPRGELDRMKNKEGPYADMNESMRLKYRDAAERRTRELENDDIDRFKLLRQADKIETPEDFDALDKMGKFASLSKLRKEVLRKSITRTKDASMDELGAWHYKADELRRQISRGEVDGTSHAEAYLDLKAFAESLPPSNERKRLLNRVDALSPFSQKGSSSGNNRRSTSYRAQAADEFDDFMQSGGFGTYHNDPRGKKDSRDGSKNNPDTLKRREADNTNAKRKAFEAKRKVDDWLELNPNASDKDFNEFLKSITGRATRNTGASILVPGDGDNLLPSIETQLPGVTPPPQ